MYKTILVPLDGSELAERVLPHVEMLAKAGVEPAEVVLLRVCELARMVMGGYGEAVGQMAILTEQAAAACKADAEEYLAAMEKRLKETGLKVRTVLLEGDSANEILEYATNNPVDLIAMVTHGRSGISRWAYGSVASKVLRGIATPLLLVTPEKK
ncbi:MAG: universal stress protein [Dehalococcoidia bacterium]